MFDLAWSEIALIAVVALVVIGPKDLPEAVRGAARGIQKLRRMVGEFQSQADELVREAKLDDVRNQIHEVRSAVSDFRNFDLKGEVERNIDPDGSMRRGFTPAPASGPDSDTWTPPPEPTTARGTTDAPAFIPPETTAPPAAHPAPDFAAAAPSAATDAAPIAAASQAGPDATPGVAPGAMPATSSSVPSAATSAAAPHPTSPAAG